ncbi:hypothetical protein HWI77_11475 [Acinetobacter venetianus]|nr:hypothetical protein HWI77_11475 [Acinetobacter venetianus]
MSIEKLTEFSKNGDNNTEDLVLESGFPSKLQPARQWMNWLFNSITSKINEVIDGLGDQYVDLTNKINNKLDLDGTAVQADKLSTARVITISGVISGTGEFDGSGNLNINTTYIKGLGINQTIKDVSSERVNGQSYQNTLDVPIQVIITIGQNTAHFAAVSEDDVNWINPVYGDGEAGIPFLAIIPPGWYCKATSFERWFELS